MGPGNVPVPGENMSGRSCHLAAPGYAGPVCAPVPGQWEGQQQGPLPFGHWCPRARRAGGGGRGRVACCRQLCVPGLPASQRPAK